ncbi:hypothetical protein L3Q82_000560 [Scortum barcoo]|uniref:Uncharacterized protein n=1 Tax=Scortum barcoo TaxID=214431 RepID=A0ACB8WF72_9TELE|nr:hypothetical protein L3Q82_000560 [Scortum barcoo]
MSHPEAELNRHLSATHVVCCLFCPLPIRLKEVMLTLEEEKQASLSFWDVTRTSDWDERFRNTGLALRYRFWCYWERVMRPLKHKEEQFSHSAVRCSQREGANRGREGYLDVRDKGRVAQVCIAWRDASYHNLQARGIRRVQILSLRRSLSYVIQGMPNIESLNLSGCYNLTDNGLGHAFVQEIPSLRVLNLSLCKQITDSSLGRIAQYLKNLEVLELGGCSNITNTGLLLIAWGLHRLKSLNLRSCRHVSDVGIGHLAGMTRSAAEGCLNLEYLTLQDCQKLTDLSLKHISKGLTKLRVLNLSFCGGISDAGMIHLSHMASLWSLNLRSCDNISDTGTMHLAMGTLRLSGLDVSFCDKIGDQTLAYIAQGLYQLKSLSLCSCHISDDGINRMVRQMHELRTLNIGQCVRITDKGLELIADHLTQLAGIDLYGCTKITKRGLERITQLPCLKVLNLGLWQMTESEKVRSECLVKKLLSTSGSVEYLQRRSSSEGARKDGNK